VTSEDPSQVNILLVDDKPENLTALKAILNKKDYRLLAARSGADALHIALRERLAVILLDVVMPEMSGFEVAGYLKQVDRTRDIPILFLTAVATDVRQIYQAYEVGAVDYLVKPLDAEVVRRKVAVFVDLVRQREEIARQARRLLEVERRDHALQVAELRVASDRR
jgi:response regulator RpfG family c-di-GMP phosphodiesterase